MDDRPLPSGIVTFVFADIEGSTRIMKRLGDGYTALLERHRVLLSQSWDAFNGHVISLEGDGSFIAFASTEDAARACVAGQRAISLEQWPTDAQVKVRMGVHCGLAAPHNGDYVALAVHQASRVINAAQGGQVLLSEEAAARCSAIAGIECVGVGRYRLRDFEEPVRLFQISADGLETTFPAIRALPAEGHNLVHPPNAFIGRESEVARLSAALAARKVVTVVGPGGVGKTRLAMEVGLRVTQSWTDGVWAVDLAAVDDDSVIEETIGAAVGVPSAGGARWREIVDFLGSRNALIVLDNIEVHVDTCARLVQDLIQGCPRLGLLTTGREPLRIAGEEILFLRPLPVPPDADPAGDASELKRWPSVRLFLDRAYTARPDAEFGPREMPILVKICRRLEGLPLAIEIAAARAAVLDPAAILAGLDDMYRLLRTNDRSLPVRQRTMQSLLDWSHRLLSLEEQAALRRLSVFGGGFSIDAAAAAVADEQLDRENVAELVWSLVDQSLAGTDLAANATRYRFLETVRQYGRRHLDESGETGSVATRLAAWYLDRLGPWKSADRAWIGDVGLELDNLRALIPLVAPFDEELAQQLACLIGRYLDTTQAFTTGIDELTRLSSVLRKESASRVALLAQLAHLHLRIGRTDLADELIHQAQRLQNRTGAPDWDDVGVSRTLGEISIRQGDHSGAAGIAQKALGGSISSRGRARMWNLLGLANSRLGNLEESASNFERELDEHRTAGNEAFVAGAAGNLAEIALRKGDYAAAAQYQRTCLDSALALGLPVNVAYSLVLAARLAAEEGDLDLAAQLALKAEAMLLEAAQKLYPDDLVAFEQLMSRIKSAVTPDHFAKLAAMGPTIDTALAAGLARQVFDQLAGPTVAA